MAQTAVDQNVQRADHQQPNCSKVGDQPLNKSFSPISALNGYSERTKPSSVSSSAGTYMSPAGGRHSPTPSVVSTVSVFTDYSEIPPSVRLRYKDTAKFLIWPECSVTQKQIEKSKGYDPDNPWKHKSNSVRSKESQVAEFSSQSKVCVLL